MKKNNDCKYTVDNSSFNLIDLALKFTSSSMVLWLTIFSIFSIFYIQHKAESLQRFMYANDIEIEKSQLPLIANEKENFHFIWGNSSTFRIFFYFTTEAIINYLNDFDFNFHALNLLHFFFFVALVRYFYIYILFLLRELQRIESISNAPIFSHCSETFLGLTTIRAYNQESRFMEILFKRMEENNVSFVILNCSNRWLGIALVRFFLVTFYFDVW